MRRLAAATPYPALRAAFSRRREKAVILQRQRISELLVQLAAPLFLALAALTLAAGARAAAPPPRPERIVSLNMCLDELLLRLADPSQIASVSWLSQDPQNANVAELAKRFPANHSLAEEAMFYHPDLVLVGRFTPFETREVLKEIGAPLVEFDVPETLEGVREQIRAVARLIGQPQRGEAMVANMDRELDAISLDPRAPKLKAIILRPNGFTVGPGSLVDELLARAGLENMAARLDIGAYEQISLERVAMLDADVLIANAEALARRPWRRKGSTIPWSRRSSEN